MRSKKTKMPKALTSAHLSTGWKTRVDYKKENRGWQRKSMEVALRILAVLEKRKMNQQDLADRLNVSRQQVSKILKGRENLTLETISKLEEVLQVEIIRTGEDQERS